MVEKTCKGNTEMCHVSHVTQEGLDLHISYVMCYNTYKGKHFSLCMFVRPSFLVIRVLNGHLMFCL
jgi:hypothetical protein